MTFKNSIFLVFSIVFFNGLFSCGEGTKDDAKSHLESIRFDVYMPIDKYVSEQNDAISELMKNMKSGVSIDWVTEMDRIEKLRNLLSVEVDHALNKLKLIRNFQGKINLKQATKNYLEEIAKFEKDIGPSLNGLKYGMDLVHMMKFSAKLRDVKDLEMSKQAFEKAQKEFAKEHGISELDLIKMEASH